MAIYHLSGQVIKRSEGRSAVACASYRCGYNLYDERLDKEYEFTRKDRVFHSEILLPENAPSRFSDRSTLWNEVEAIEKRKDAQLAREFNIALPTELTPEQNKILAQEFCQTLVDDGMIVDLCLHNIDGDNPHFHIMTTLRDVDKSGFLKKNRDWNQKEFLEQIRLNWEKKCNEHLKKNNLDITISSKSLRDQNSDLVPQIHHGNRPELIERNNKIIENNVIYEIAKSALKRAKSSIVELARSFTTPKQKEVHKTTNTATLAPTQPPTECTKCHQTPCNCHKRRKNKFKR